MRSACTCALISKTFETLSPEAQGAWAQAYGAQAVVVSIDPRRVWVADPADTPRPTVATANFGPHGEAYCWWQACDWASVYSPGQARI